MPVTKRRRNQIMERLMSAGRVDVKALARDMDVSEATVRRDLRTLAGQRRLELVYGGAKLPAPSETSLESRSQRNMDAKRLVGRLAADLVSDREMLYVDGGTTCMEMRHLLKERRGLSVIVNSWRWAVELAGTDGNSVIQIGGHYRPERADCVGPLAAQSIDQLRGYVAFISADGLSTDFGLWSNDIETAYLYQHVIRNARDTVLLVDHTKFDAPSLFRICDWGPVSRIVTDRKPSAQWLEFFEERGVRVVFEEERT